MSAGPATAGWYADPYRTAQLRWWDGRQWSGYVVGAPIPPAPSSPLPVAPAPAWAPPPRYRLPGLGVAALGLLGGSGLGFLIVFILDRAGQPGGTAVTLSLSEVGLWSGLVGAVFFASRRWGTGRFSTDFGWRIRPVDAGLGVLGAAAGHAAGAVAVLPLYAAFHDLVRQPQVGLPQDQIHGAVWPVYGVIVILGAPVNEELFFRGLVQTRLVARLGPAWGIAATSVIFGAAHLIGWQGAGSLLAATAIAASGAVLGFLRYRTGRLGTSTVAHALFNAMAFALLAAGV